ncbi:hypothetical protein CASFOL_003963 [Castilleja foliolosa]|uniref:Pentatricopeptide repeat-containing protein n=1 Tax=Castilleja foliolosa TaxID=1961234 RepID=A0ABD3EJA2_9LAMI
MALYMPLFKVCKTLKPLTILHAHLIVNGLRNDPLASTKLIETYSQTGCLQSSRRIFNTFPNPDSFMWGVLIKCHVWNGMFREAISVYQEMLRRLGELNEFILPSVLRACSAINDLIQGKKVHARIVKSGFQSDPIVETSLLSLYGETGCLHDACKVFDEMSTRDLVSWSSLISNYVRNGHAVEGLGIFKKMVSQGVEIDSVTMLSVAEACGELGLSRIGKSCHGYVTRRNIIRIDHEALVSSLIAMYAKFGDLCSAENLFYNGVYHSVSSWTALISCYNQNAHYLEALLTFVKMLGRKVEINGVTLMNVLCSCARLGLLEEGKSIHGYVVRNNIELDIDFLRSSLIDLYANCGQLRYSRQIFDNTEDKHLVSWNILISGYVRSEMADEALSLFVEMIIRGILVDSFAVASALSACGIIGFSGVGCQIHCLIIKTNLQNEFLENALIDMYSKCGFINSANQIFHGTKKDSVITWNSMMCGFSQNGYSNEALNLFDEMCVKNFEMDEVTFLSAIQACSNLGFIDKGKWVHHKVITFGIRSDMYIDTALANMYARSGDLRMARKVFDKMPERSVVSWSSMIGSYAMHGHVDEAISLFNKMVELGIKPNDVTFMNILSACSHAGYVERGKSYFNSMVKDFGLIPNLEHYECLVDLQSRAGDLNGAYEVINSMPFKADARVWGALVNGCRIHNRMDFLENINMDLLNMDADDTGYYTLLSNVYAEGGKWNEATMVRSKMRSLNLKKEPGYSMIEIELNS